MSVASKPEPRRSQNLGGERRFDAAGPAQLSSTSEQDRLTALPPELLHMIIAHVDSASGTTGSRAVFARLRQTCKLLAEVVTPVLFTQIFWSRHSALHDDVRRLVFFASTPAARHVKILSITKPAHCSPERRLSPRQSPTPWQVKGVNTAIMARYQSLLLRIECLQLSFGPHMEAFPMPTAPRLAEAQVSRIAPHLFNLREICFDANGEAALRHLSEHCPNIATAKLIDYDVSSPAVSSFCNRLTRSLRSLWIQSKYEMQLRPPLDFMDWVQGMSLEDFTLHYPRSNLLQVLLEPDADVAIRAVKAEYLFDAERVSFRHLILESKGLFSEICAVWNRRAHVSLCGRPAAEAVFQQTGS